MSTFIFITLVALAFFGPRILAWARTADWSDYHLAHGPQSGCLECADK
jgi:hypothetical protein